MKRLYAIACCVFALAAPCWAAQENEVRIPLRLNVPEFAPESAVPVAASIPLPRGTLNDPAAVVLVDRAGSLVPCQRDVLARWTPRGSVKWLEISFACDPKETYSVVVGSGLAAPAAKARVRVTRQARAVRVHTGALDAAVGADGGLRIERGGKVILDAPKGFLYFVSNAGAEYRAFGPASDMRIDVESAGPERAIVRLEGWYVDSGGRRCARQITRLQFFRGRTCVKVVHTFVITEDTNKVWFRELGLRLPVKLSGPVTAVLDKSHKFDAAAEEIPLAAGEAATLFQEVYKHHGEEAARGVVGKVRAGKVQVLAKSDRVGEWACVRGRRNSVTAVVRDFWQTFPKEIEVRPDAMVIRLFSNRAGRELDFRAASLVKYWGKWGSLWRKGRGDRQTIAEKPSNAAGLARTHEVWLFFDPAAEPTDAIARKAHVVQEPILALPEPKWNCATGLFGPLSVRDPKRFPKEERLVSDFFDWIVRFGEHFGHWGFLEYGTVHAMVYGRGDRGAHRLAATKDKKWRAGFYRYGRARYGFMQNAWHLYLRSGERKYYDVARIMSNHLMDIQMVHWDLPQKFRGGYATGVWKYLHWHTPMMWGCTEADKPLMTYGNLSMLVREYLYPYYITGQRRAKDVVAERLEGVKRKWNFEEVKAHEERSKYSMLFNLATLYSFSWDKKILSFIDLLSPHLIDRDSPFGLRHRNMPYGDTKASYVVHYLPRKAAWTLEFAESMQSPPDRAAALRAIRHAYELNKPDGSYSALGQDYASYYLATGDTSVLWRLRQLVDEKMKLYWNDERNGFDSEAEEKSGRVSPMHRTGSIMATIPYALTAFAAGPERVRSREMIMAREALLDYCGIGNTPIYVKPAPAKTTVVEVFTTGDLPWLSGAPLHVRSSKGPKPGALRVTTHSTPTQGGSVPYYFRYYHRVTIGPGETAEWYRLLPGQGAPYRAVGPTDMPAVVRMPPEGFVVSRMQLRSMALGPRWFFFVPKGSASFVVDADGPVRVTTPDGKIMRDFDAKTGPASIKVPAGADGRAWGLRSKEHLTRIRLAGVPPFLAFGRPERLFLPKGWERMAAAEWPRPAAKGSAYWPGRSGAYGDLGLYLGEGSRLAVPLSGPAAQHLARSGTVELWLQSNFNSESLPDRSSKTFASSADGKAFSFYWGWHKQGRNWINFFNWGANLRGNVADGKSHVMRWVNVTFAAGTWTHLALTWEAKESDIELGLFVNGKAVKSRRRSTWKKGLAIKWGKEILVGGRPGSKGWLEGVADEVRISRGVRYKQDFIPTVKPLKPDKGTLFLFHLNGNTQGVAGDGSRPKAEIRTGLK